MTEQEYNDNVDLINRGQQVHVDGRTALTIAELDFIRNAEPSVAPAFASIPRESLERFLQSGPMLPAQILANLVNANAAATGNSVASGRETELQTQIDQMKASYETSWAEITKENEELQGEITALKDENAKLTDENAKLTDENAKLTDENAKLTSQLQSAVSAGINETAQAGEAVAVGTLPADFPNLAQLTAANITTIDAVKPLSKDDLIKIPGIGDASADKILTAAAAL